MGDSLINAPKPTQHTYQMPKLSLAEGQVIDLSGHLAAIHVEGSDSAKLLQGQLTNDIYQLDHSNCQLTAHLNHKGRILALFMVTKLADGSYLLVTPSAIVSKIIARLKMFVLRSKVVISQLSCLINLVKHPQNSISAGTFNLAIAHGYSLNVGLTFDGAPLTDGTSQERLSQASLAAIDDSATSGVWQWKQLLVEQMLPLVYPATSEMFTPQQLNLDQLNAVSFTKGCYTGQEIVARTHYLGKVKRRMWQVASDYPLAIGQKIVSPKLDNQEVGVVVECYSLADKYYALASVQSDCIDQAYLDSANTQPLKFVHQL